MGEKSHVYKILVGKSEGIYHSEDRCVYGRPVLNFILEHTGVWIGFIWLRVGTNGGLL
jgi:hypothetical protein